MVPHTRMGVPENLPRLHSGLAVVAHLIFLMSSLSYAARVNPGTSDSFTCTQRIMTSPVEPCTP